ncbi:MAG: hypothetical protein R2911_13855 [Caldilineaceae bacterium]
MVLVWLILTAALHVLATPITNALVGFGPNETFPENSLPNPTLWPYIQWRLGIGYGATTAHYFERNRGKSYWLVAD